MVSATAELSGAPLRAGMRVLVVSGISGSGKSVVLNTLEDLGYFCIDNLPSGLMREVVEHAVSGGGQNEIAVGIDARNRPSDLSSVPRALSELAAAGVETTLLFIESNDEVLIRRYSETRRRHPLSGPGSALREAITRERSLMQPIRAIADLLLDTSELNVHQLRRRVVTDLGLSGAGMSLLFESFAYKRGVPSDADFVFDARSLPNPHWDARLRPLSGRDAVVRDWLESQPQVSEFRDHVGSFLARWLPDADSVERSYVTVALGCTGGRHRSVYLAEALAEQFRARFGAVLCFHRELA